MLPLSEVKAQGPRQRRLGSDDNVVDPMGAQAAIPFFEGIFHRVPVRRTDVGDVNVEFIPGLGIEEACVARGRKLPLTRVDQVENEDFVSLMPQETQGRPRRSRVHQEIGQQDHEPSTTQPDGDITERRVS